MTEPDYVAINREGWTRANADYTDRQAEGAWAQTEITWGQWSQPESEIRMLPDVTGLDVIELGCGTAYFGAWLKRAGARRVVGVAMTSYSRSRSVWTSPPRSSRPRAGWTQSTVSAWS